QGADIAEIELIIQFGVPSSLSVWTQRAGRAGRSPEVHARAILLIPPTAPTQTAEPTDGLQWGKVVVLTLREYISTVECRRDMTDVHFDNPPRRR
ncbi:hypothetical protein DFH06DRAFT_922515, partial [Mycena polygramma]